jgi:hypothetical protein
VPSVLDAALAEREAFGFEPELVVIGADPGLAVPTESVLAAAYAAFKLIEQRMGKNAVVHGGHIAAAYHLAG